MALYYHSGPHIVEHGKPASAFSKGDLLEWNSSSSLSYADALFAGSIIAGVALSCSTSSVDDKVPFLLPTPTTKFWTTATAANSQAVARFNIYDLSPASGDWELGSSQNSSLAVVWSTSSEDATIVERDSESADSWVVISINSTPLFDTGTAT